MRKLVTILALSLLTVSLAFAGWEFDHVLFAYDTLAVSDSYGMHGVTVDPDGKIWFAMHNWPTSTVYPPGDTVDVYGIMVYNADGTEADISPVEFLTIDGAADTLKSSCKGLATAADGNILHSVSGKMYKINYQTGEGIGMYDFPDYTGSLTKPAVADDGKIFLSTVGPGQPVKILNPDLTELGNAIDDNSGCYNRAVAVSPNGQNLYLGSTWNGLGVRVYTSALPGVLPHEPSDTLGNFYQADTLYATLWPEDVTYGPDDRIYAANTQIGFTGDTEHGSLWWVIDAVTGETLYSLGAAEGYYDQGGIWNGRGAAWNSDGTVMYLADFGYNCVTVWNQVPDAVDSPVALPAEFSLAQNHPNPFNPSTTIPFELKEDGQVTLTVYDMQGREVATLVNAPMTVGSHSVNFDGSNLASGVYVYQIAFNGNIAAKSMLLVK